MKSFSRGCVKFFRFSVFLFFLRVSPLSLKRVLACVSSVKIFFPWRKEKQKKCKARKVDEQILLYQWFHVNLHISSSKAPKKLFSLHSRRGKNQFI